MQHGSEKKCVLAPYGRTVPIAIHIQIIAAETKNISI